jgi:predicted small lipoprotein YifL
MKRFKSSPLKVFGLLAACLCVCIACGQRGPLYLPDDQPASPAPRPQAENPGAEESEDEDGSSV